MPVVQPSGAVRADPELDERLLLLAGLAVLEVHLVALQVVVVGAALRAAGELALAAHDLRLRAPAQAHRALLVAREVRDRVLLEQPAPPPPRVAHFRGVTATGEE